MSTARFNTLANAAGSKSVPVDTVVDGSAKAWVNFNGTGTVAIRQAFNCSSLVDNGVGDYTINFASAMADANYSLASMSRAQSSGGVSSMIVEQSFDTAQTTSSVRLVTKQAGAFFDSTQVTVAIFR